MGSYRTIAMRYIKMNKKRSIITVFGVVVTTLVLFAGLNFAYSMVVAGRDNIRKERDYEIVILTESQETVEQILADSRVKSAYVGPYYFHNRGEEQLYPNALYVNTYNPYRMDEIRAQLSREYDVETDYNGALADLYLQGNNPELAILILLTTLLISYIFAIFGVGIVRNSIQLCALENIRDYGNLRCIGASKSQLKGIIFYQGVILELIGIGIGTILGTIVSIIIGLMIKVPVGFHPIGLVLILILFMGDLYFTMGENSKLITGMTPIAAIRGEYRVRKEKLKLRDKNLFGKLFGIEGDYAYKNLMRNPLRFIRTIAAMALGVAAFITIAGFISSINGIMKKEEKRYEYYQIYIENMLEIEETIDTVHATLPTVEAMRELTDMEEITEVKRMYSAEIHMTDPDAYYEKLTEEYLTETEEGNWIQGVYEKWSDPTTREPYITEEIVQRSYRPILTGVECYGYDEEDYQRHQSVLLEGTLDISENGIVIVNQGNMKKPYGDEDSLAAEEFIDVTITNYHVGDTIDIVNMERFRSEMTGILKELDQELKQMEEQARQEYAADSEELGNALGAAWSVFSSKRTDARVECWDKLMAEGDYRTYTIEGIVSEDVNHLGSGFRIILPLERYFALTGTDESMNTGMQFHVERYPRVKEFSLLVGTIYASGFDDYGFFGGSYSMGSTYPATMDFMISIKKRTWYVVLIVIFVALMASLNFINTTASNLHLRRREFAQLRVIGTSKERLMKMVLLEGVISTVLSNLFGILLGCAMSYGVFQILTTLYALKFHIPVMAILLSLAVSFLLLCGSIYMPLKNLGRDLAVELKTGGD